MTNLSTRTLRRSEKENSHEQEQDAIRGEEREERRVLYAVRRREQEVQNTISAVVLWAAMPAVPRIPVVWHTVIISAIPSVLAGEYDGTDVGENLRRNSVYEE